MEMIERPDLVRRVREALSESSAVILIGPRQVGKTTLARAIASEMSGQDAEALVLDLERFDDLRKLDDARAFLELRIGKLTVIDEVHRSPRLFEELRGLIDEARRQGQRAGQFLLLGSASLDLIQQTSESLAGRVRYLEQVPISPSETDLAGIDRHRLWLRGGFPESLLARNDVASLIWRGDFIRSYLERDIPMFAPRLPAALIGRLWRMLAAGQGNILNSARLAAGLGISGATVERYIDLLCDLLLVRRLLPWSTNIGKRLVKSPKIYVRDSGITHALLEIGTYDQLIGNPIVGPSFEGHVIEALIGAAGDHARPYFFRTSNGAEIDLLFEKAGSPHIAVEVKLTSAPAVPRGFHQACDDLAIGHRILVHGGTGGSWPMPNGVHACSLIQAIESIKTLTADPFGGVY
jgi:predicted AAA+ superfamily ATPase